jgi:hypothetical protein
VDNAWQRKTRVIAYEMAGSKFPDYFVARTTKVGRADRRKSGCTESGTTTQLGAQLQTLVAYENQIAVTKTRSSMWHSKSAHFFRQVVAAIYQILLQIYMAYGTNFVVSFY